MNRGLLKSILYYAIGFTLAWISYLIFGPSYHAPGLHHLIIFLTFLVGFFWLISALRKYFLGTGTGSQNLKWIIGVNLGMCLGFVLLLILLFYYTPDNGDLEQDPEQITIEESGDTTTIYNRGNIVYIKVKDSVLINFIDSTKVDWSKTVMKEKQTP